MRLIIKHQESYSRGELLLRQIFGIFYIFLPHMFVLLFVSIWGSILRFLAFWIILFTGVYPESFFEFQLGLLKWQTRLNARMFNLSDGYPAFGVNATDEFTDIKMNKPEKLSRGLLIVKVMFGVFYVGIPHMFILYFRILGTMILNFLSFWAVLFAGRYPKSWHEFNVGTLRWMTRLNLYLGLWMTDEYPPFTGRELPHEIAEFPDVEPETEIETINE